NPAVTWPNTPKVKKALQKLDFLVVMDIFMTATAEMADIVLPACTFPEKLNPTRWRGWFLGQPVIEPLWESWPDSKFWIELAKKMGYESYFPWKRDEEIVDCFYEPSGLTVKKILEADPSGYIHLQTLPGQQQYKEKGFRTPSRKVELYSTQLNEMGHEPLPVYIEPRESPISTPALFQRFPLTLTTGTREIEWYHSEHRHLEGLRRRKPEPVAQIHPQTAAKYGIVDGGMMRVETHTGSLEIKAGVIDEMMEDMVSVPHGWPQASENMLTDDVPADPVSGYPALTALLCTIRPIRQ
ncbi:MAG: molybdopterin dinucleotide binding domain-containing protein, partial [Dehalococcoidia bacterium]